MNEQVLNEALEAANPRVLLGLPTSLELESLSVFDVAETAVRAHKDGNINQRDLEPNIYAALRQIYPSTAEPPLNVREYCERTRLLTDIAKILTSEALEAIIVPGETQ